MIERSLPKSQFQDQSFDYVVVGSGAGGAPLAARLAEYGYTVLVLEAGPDHSCPESNPRAYEISQVPALHAPSTEDPELSWQFFVKHYKKPPASDPKADDRGIFYPRATGIGGCTIHNAMITLAGPAADWDELAALLNDPSWGADVMRGYFRRLERCEYLSRPERPRRLWDRFKDAFWWLLGRDDDPTAGRHGFDGWLHTSFIDLSIGLKDHQLIKMLLAAAVTAAREGIEAPTKFVKQVLRGEFNEELDPNHFRRQTERPEGLTLIPTAIVGPKTQTKAKCGHRSSPANRLLDASEQFGNRLVIATNCLATELVFKKNDGGELHATGVKYLHGSRLYGANPRSTGEQPAPQAGIPGVAVAKREVILCGGTFNTPQLLMLSGIGPAAHLKAHGIECKINSPGVGQNLQDRYEVTVVSKMKEKFSVLDGATFKLPGPADKPDAPLQQWRSNGSGLYATNGAILGILKRSRPDLAQPDLFIFGIPLKFRGYQIGYSVVDPNEYDLFTWAILKAHTQNRGGTVKLASSCALDVPNVNFNYFGSARDELPKDDADLAALVEGVRFVREIATEAGVGGANEFFPGQKHDGMPDVRKWIQRDAWGHHACGTCRMGRWTDPMAVINSRFCVLGAVDLNEPRRLRKPVSGLRVVDASIFPNIPGYFIVSNVYMASEKAADLIHEAAVEKDIKAAHAADLAEH